MSEIITPERGKWGKLYSPIYGGGSWLAEFSLVTGQSPFAFGADAFVLQYLLAGRLQTSLSKRASDSGFVSSVIYPVSGHFINAKNFYEGLGFNFYNTNDISKHRWTLDDNILFDKTAEVIKGNERNLIFMVTMENHGPHDLLDPFSDYFRRLQIQSGKLVSFKKYLNRHYIDYENYIVSYGDHQPAFTRSYLKDKLDRHTTFWSIDCIGNCKRFAQMEFPGKNFGLEFLATVVTSRLDAMPEDGVARAHKLVMSNGCMSLQFACSREWRNTFNWIYAKFIDLPKFQHGMTEGSTIPPS